MSSKFKLAAPIWAIGRLSVTVVCLRGYAVTAALGSAIKKWLAMASTALIMASALPTAGPAPGASSYSFTDTNDNSFNIIGT